MMLVDGIDDKAGASWDFTGQYIDNTDVFEVMKTAIVPEKKPKPAVTP